MVSKSSFPLLKTGAPPKIFRVTVIVDLQVDPDGAGPSSPSVSLLDSKVIEDEGVVFWEAGFESDISEAILVLPTEFKS